MCLFWKKIPIWRLKERRSPYHLQIRLDCFRAGTDQIHCERNVIIITIVIIMIVIMIIFFTIIIIKDLRLRAVEITATGCCESHFPPFPLKPWNVILQSLLITEVIISRLLR